MSAVAMQSLTSVIFIVSGKFRNVKRSCHIKTIDRVAGRSAGRTLIITETHIVHVSQKGKAGNEEV